MSKIDCGACQDLRENAPDFVQNGVTDKVCASLHNDTGFNPNLSTLHTDCEDLDKANDCLIGQMDGQLEAHDVCDWKPFMHKFIPNLHALLTAMICAICGIWKNIHSLWAKVNKHDCEINNLYDGFTMSVGEEPTDNSYVVAGKGVSFLNRSGSSDQYSSDIRLLYIGGALARLTGSLTFYTTDFTDGSACVNYDNGSTESTSANRKGNSFWGETGDTVDGNELIYEIRIKKSAYPQLKTIYGGFGQSANTGGIQCTHSIFTAGEYAYGQHGACDSSTGAPKREGYDSGHLVPDGWIYLQLRMSYIMALVGSSGQRNVTPRSFLGMRFDRDGLDC